MNALLLFRVQDHSAECIVHLTTKEKKWFLRNNELTKYKLTNKIFHIASKEEKIFGSPTTSSFERRKSSFSHEGLEMTLSLSTFLSQLHSFPLLDFPHFPVFKNSWSLSRKGSTKRTKLANNHKVWWCFALY